MTRAFDRDRWAQLSALLDQALDLTAGERTAWLDGLRAREPDLAAEVQSLLDEHAAVEREDFLGGEAAFGPPGSLAGQTFGPYTLRSEIGFGGMGSVWLAERTDGRFSGRVAVKLLNASQLGRQGEARFRREGSILARLRHPNIAHLVDAGISASGQPFLVLEHVEGQSIDAYCDRRALGVDARIRLFLDVLGAVSHAHSLLVVHRDIKPSNVLVSDQGAVKLLDFGIAKLLEPEPGEDALPLTREGEAMLTPEYAAPEQLTGQPVTTRTDVYALGVLLYVLLSGRHPAGAATSSPAELVRAIVEGEPVRLSDVADDTVPASSARALDTAARRGSSPRRLRALLRGDLENIVGKALKKDPAERYESVEGLAADLRRYLKQEPVRARPDTLRYRAAKFVRRNRTAVALAALAVAALGAGLLGTWSQARRAREQAALAEAQRARADQEAAAATRQRDFALRELARAEAVNGLNTFLLADAGAAGRFTTGELLERAERIARRQHGEGDATKVDLLIQVGEQHLNRGDGARAVRVLTDAHGLALAVAEPSTRARAACSLADALRQQSDYEQARRMLDEGLRLLPDQPQYIVHRVVCLISASQLAIYTDAIDEGVARAEEAQRLQRASRVPSLLLDLDVSMQLAEAYRVRGRLREAAAAGERAFALLDDLGRGDTDRAATVLNNWGLAEAALGRHLDAERHIRRALQMSEADGSKASASPTVVTNLARILRELDRWDEAAALAERAERAARAEGELRAVRRALTVRASVYRLAGQLDRAQRTLELEPRVRREEVPTHISFAILASERAALALARGNVATAQVGADRAVTLAEASGQSSEYLPVILIRRAEVALAAAQGDRGLADGQRALALWQATQGTSALSSWQGQAYLVQARALRALGRQSEAQSTGAEAARHLAPTLGPDHRLTREARQLAAL
jgi:serine/threonine-protein kinase